MYIKLIAPILTDYVYTGTFHRPTFTTLDGETCPLPGFLHAHSLVSQRLLPLSMIFWT